MIKKIVLFVELLAISVVSFSQEKATPYSVELSTQYGFFLPHHQYLNYFITSHLPSLQLNVSKQKKSNAYWSEQLKKPEVGYGFYYLDMKNPAVLGQVLAGYAFIDKPYYRKNTHSLLYRAALGLSYATKPFNRLTNYTNVALGSHWNVYVELGFLVEWNLSQKLFLKTGINFTHFSNGNISEPNFGANVVSATARIRYNFITKQQTPNTYAPSFVPSKVAYSVLWSAGVKMRDVKTRQLFPVSSLSVSRHHKYASRKMWTIALDLFYDQSLPVFYREAQINYHPFDLSYYGVHLSHEWCFGRVHFTTQLGGYIYAKWDDYNHYHRFGLRYALAENVWLAVSLKTYYAQADFIEWGLAYSWPKKQDSNLRKNR